MAQAAESGVSEFASATFAKNLYNALKSTSGNVFFSPYSLQVALAMAYTGAGGNTAKEMQKVVPFAEDRAIVHKGVKQSAAVLRSSPEVTLNVANGIFLQKDFHVKDSYVKDIKEVYEGESKALNFAKSDEAANEINMFVNKKTNGKIQELFSSSAFTSMTKMVLVNAIYFKGAWLNKFDPNDTVKGDFHLNNKDKVQVDYMTITKKFNALESADLNSIIVELPYVGDLSMVLIVPNDIEGIKHLESKLQNINFENILAGSDNREVQLKMPKFKLEQKLELANTLKQMGMKDMFSETGADFSGITDRNDIFVSDVVQKAFIEVNEEGSEAAAATGFVLMAVMLDLTPRLDLNVDRPFIFLLRHVPTGTPLFVGRFSGF